jgi:hypothetical protein
MAGSMTWRKYTSDSGADYSAKIDESNAGAIIGASPVFMPARTVNNPQLPRGLQKRYVLATNVANPKLKRKFYVGTQAILNTILGNLNTPIVASDYPGATGTTAGTNTNWTVTYVSGEKSRLTPIVTAADTGLDDGTTTQ